MVKDAGLPPLGLSLGCPRVRSMRQEMVALRQSLLDARCNKEAVKRMRDAVRSEHEGGNGEYFGRNGRTVSGPVDHLHRRNPFLQVSGSARSENWSPQGCCSVNSGVSQKGTAKQPNMQDLDKDLFRVGAAVEDEARLGRIGTAAQPLPAIP